MRSILIVGDIHLSDKNPISRIDDYNEAIFKKLDQIYFIAVENRVDGLVLLGDIFHLKSASRNSYRTVIRMMQYIKRFKAVGIPVLKLVGNHDLIHGDITSVRTQPIGVLGEMDNVYDGLLINVAHHIDMQVIGIDYTNEPMDKQLERIQSIERTARCMVVCLHTNVAESGALFKEVAIRTDEITNKNIDVIVNGHIHYPTLLRMNSSGIAYIQPGSISRESCDDENIKRDINVVLLGFDGVDIKTKVIKLDVEPAEKIFDLTTRNRVKSQDKRVEFFVDTLKQFSTAKTGDVEINLEEMGLDPDLKGLVQQYLSGGDASVDKL